MLDSSPRTPLTPQEIAHYESDGVVCLRGRFDLEWVQLLREATDRCIASPGPHAVIGDRAGPGFFFADQDMWWRDESFQRFLFDSPAAHIAANVMGSRSINFFFDQVIVKEPGTVQRTPWHQDLPYWAVKGSQICAIWLALDPIAAVNSVEYVLGSHRWGTEFSPRHFADGSLYQGSGLPPLPDIDAHRSEYQICSWDMEPGDCLVFQAMMVHGAAGNNSLAHRRRAVSTRWCGDDARYCKRPGEVAVPSKDPGLADGDLLTCALFPRVWPHPADPV
jgi:ectoine hydroxylase-related dioxygenase (phytanoyl-CoA dioxygenase family)